MIILDFSFLREKSLLNRGFLIILFLINCNCTVLVVYQFLLILEFIKLNVT